MIQIINFLKVYQNLKLFQQITTLNLNLDINNTKSLKIYKIVSNNNILKKLSGSNHSIFFLLRRKNAPNVEGILKTGFNPSKAASYGPGRYLTCSIDYAYRYSISVATKESLKVG